ncbi:Hypothetical_protein [Hexamita inflata]|uniref:Hypothetical_protein n=1 Tax=Hexamita inflata TaxID=28002 RepID=A0AA86U1Z4_9EUKA|nr:Hypothetical protein HINF_LOCUS15813 [Hexamita inflata]
MSHIETMFQTAKFYFVVTWDEIQVLNDNDLKEDSSQHEMFLSSFLKNIMITVNSPCQHIAAGSLSVSILTILKKIPVNGRSIMNCQQAIVTSSNDPQSLLNLVIHLKNYGKMSKSIQKHALKTLSTQNINLTCANLNQILPEMQIDIDNIHKYEELIDNSVTSLKNEKIKIASEWLNKSISSIDIYNKEIHNLIIGTIKQPSILLEKLCSYDESTRIYKIIDSTLRQSLEEQLNNLDMLNENSRYFYFSSVFLESGNLSYQLKTSLQQDKFNQFWKRVAKQNQNKSQKDQQNIIKFQYIFFLNTEQDNIQFKRNRAQNNHERLQYNKSELLKQFQNQENITNLSDLSTKAWSNGCDILERLRNKFSYDNVEYSLQLVKDLQMVFVGSEFTTIQDFVTQLRGFIKLILLNKVDFK